MLLSIKPKYAKIILEGKKQYEFRKNKPKKELKQMKKLGKLLDKMKKSGWNITEIDYSILNKE